MDFPDLAAGVREARRCYPGDTVSGLMTMTAPRAFHRSSLALGALPAAVPRARRHARQVIREWMLPVDIDICELLVCELVTNGLKAAVATDGRPPVGLRLSAGSGLLLIEVWDGSNHPPVPRELDGDVPGLGEEGGRGLFLVETLSASWDWYPTRNPAGKVTWCELLAPP
jgi:anti-sigma regulatory factor (Ser/Thr protein kinase)